MKRVFAPWRMTYITRGDQKSCVFCDLPAAGECPETLILHKGRLAYVILNRYPYITGHLMVVPYRHVESPLLLTPEEWAETADLVRPAVEFLTSVYRPQGFNVGMNVGRAAGAGIHEHIHMHVLPRWNGDTNFVPVLSETRVIPEALEETWRRLRPLFQAFKGSER